MEAMRESMEIYPRTAAERAMKLHEVLLRASAGKIKWWQAAELMGISSRQLRRWRKRLEEQGHKGLLDRRRGIPSRRQVPKAKAEEVLSLYRDKYFDLNVRHFHEKLREEHQIGLSYTWVKQALQGAGLVKRKARRGVHRKRRERRPLPGMMLHIDGSDGRGQPASQRSLHRRVQPPLYRSGSAARYGVYILPAQESGDDLHATIRAHS
jgi:transposase